MKKLRLRPSLKEPKRYVAFRIISPFAHEICYEDLESSVYNVLLEFLGECGLSEVGFKLVKSLFDEESKTFVVKCKAKYVPRIIASLAFLSELGNEKLVLRVLKVSGTIKGLGLKKKGSRKKS